VSLWFSATVVIAAGGDTRLPDAAMRADRDAIKSLLQQKIDVNAAQPDGTTALHWATRQNDLATTQLLLRAGAKPDAVTRYGLTPLYFASVNGNAAMVELLLRAGVEANASNPGGETALMTASRTGNLDTVKLLVDRGAAVNAKESVRGQTALMWSVVENHPRRGEVPDQPGRRHQCPDKCRNPGWNDWKTRGPIWRYRRPRTRNLQGPGCPKPVRWVDRASIRGAGR
jgi:ankyrin repeat protein